MGTELQRAGIGPGECYEAWNLTHPDRVRAIHRAYVAAGAEVLLTNTFQANPFALRKHGEQENLAAIFKAAVAHARSALSSGGFVLTDLGPFAQPDEELVVPMLEAAWDADGLLLETFSDPADVNVFVRMSRTFSGPMKPLLVSFTFDGGSLRTFKDKTPEECASAAVDWGVAALGVNCGRNLDGQRSAEILRRYRAVTELPLFVRPNAGTPTRDAGRWVYPLGPVEWAGQLSVVRVPGVVMLGGCCGTTPEHIKELAACGC